jgi:hypothetical protein
MAKDDKVAVRCVFRRPKTNAVDSHRLQYDRLIVFATSAFGHARACTYHPLIATSSAPPSIRVRVCCRSERYAACTAAAAAEGRLRRPGKERIDGRRGGTGRTNAISHTKRRWKKPRVRVELGDHPSAVDDAASDLDATGMCSRPAYPRHSNPPRRCPRAITECGGGAQDRLPMPSSMSVKKK